ncbi:MAG: hypothetical protein Q8P32_01900 [Candidatus Komeilibacteria bacterium]|nr:hypothetical protein [Candidatus Komeilibacteria bacterium]
MNSTHKNQPQGTVLILVMIVMSGLVLLLNYFFDFIISERKIAKSHILAAQTYYLTEAGVQEAIWKINHDPVWNDNFKNNPAWQAAIEREDLFVTGQSYEVGVKNVLAGEAVIHATGTITVGAQTSRRVVKTTIFQAQGETATSSIGVFTNNNFDLSGANLSVNDSAVFSNNQINLDFFSVLNVDKKALAFNNVSVSWLSELNAEEILAKNYPPRPDTVSMPQLDFDSNDPDSLLNQADFVYTQNQFADLLADNPNLVLNGSVYVKGEITVPRGSTVSVSGFLAAKNNINIGTSWWPYWLNKASVSLSDPGNGPVGLFAKHDINIGSYASQISVNGVIYANSDITVTASGLDFSVSGAVYARNFSLSSLWEAISVNYNANRVFRTLGLSAASPLINVNHWEEEY